MIQIPIESMNLVMLNIGCARLNANWNWQDVNSPFIRIFYVVEGEAVLHLTGVDISLTPGHLYIVPAYTTHSYECHGVFVHYYLHIYEGFKSEMSLDETYELPTEVAVDRSIEKLFEYVCSQQPDARLPESDPKSYDTSAQTSDYIKRYNSMALWEKMELRGAMLMIVSNFIHWAKPRVWTQNERMKRVLKHIHTHIADDIRLDDLADVACLSKPYFIRLFKQEFDMSPLQYINKKKMERAQLLLFATNDPVKQVAYRLGISDYSYFTRLFHKTTGVTPQEYRRRLRA